MSSNLWTALGGGGGNKLSCWESQKIETPQEKNQIAKNRFPRTQKLVIWVVIDQIKLSPAKNSCSLHGNEVDLEPVSLVQCMIRRLQRREKRQDGGRRRRTSTVLDAFSDGRWITNAVLHDALHNEDPFTTTDMRKSYWRSWNIRLPWMTWLFTTDNCWFSACEETIMFRVRGFQCPHGL